MALAVAVTWCCCAPPSDQPVKCNGRPGGDAANTVWTESRGTVRVNGTVCAAPSTVTWMPGWFDVKVRSTVFAVIVCFTVCVSPPVSVAVRKIS